MQLACELESKLKAMTKENEELRENIKLSKKRRKEASKNAARLAEDNYYLETCLCEIFVESNNLKRENKRLLLENIIAPRKIETILNKML